MHIVQFILLPLSWLYGKVVYLRNWAYEKGILATYVIPMKSIVIGNIQLGGTGKTPHLAYILGKLQGEKIAVISRGYRRKTKGTIQVEGNSTFEDVGDEPLELYRKFPHVPIIVDEDRKRAIAFIRAEMPYIEVLLFDDAFQHRSVKAGLNILLTTWDKPYSSDHYLPSGRLRDHKSRAKDAQITLITKCPKTISPSEKMKFVSKYKLPADVMFTSLAYHSVSAMNNKDVCEIMNPVVLLSAIAMPEYFEQAAREKFKVIKHFKFGDHHAFSGSELDEIGRFIRSQKNPLPILVTTEKDASRLYQHPWLNSNADLQIFILPISIVEVDDQLPFYRAVIDYVKGD